MRSTRDLEKPKSNILAGCGYYSYIGARSRLLSEVNFKFLFWKYQLTSKDSNNSRKWSKPYPVFSWSKSERIKLWTVYFSINQSKTQMMHIWIDLIWITILALDSKLTRQGRIETDWSLYNIYVYNIWLWYYIIFRS